MAEALGSPVDKVESEEIDCILGNRRANHIEVIIKNVELIHPYPKYISHG